MKILFVNHLLDPVSGGGTAERTFQLARFLSKQGCECGILTLEIGDTGTYEGQLYDVPVFKLPCLNRRYYIHITWPWRIKHLIARFDAVHLMGHWTMLNALVALRCIQQGKPYVLCPAGALKPYGRSRWLKKIYDWVIGKKILGCAKRWVAITHEEKRELAAKAIPEKFIEVIPNGIDPGQYPKPRNSLSALESILGDAQYLLFLGRLNVIKGPDLLLEAFAGIAAQFPGLHLVFAGPDSGQLASLRDMAADAGIKNRVHFAGYLGGEAKVSALHKAACLVIPSRNEAMSIVVLEAGICTTPVLFTNRCGLEEFAEANAGTMVPASVEGLYQGLQKMLSNPDEMKKTAERLNIKVRNEFLWESQAAKYHRLYQELLG